MKATRPPVCAIPRWIGLVALSCAACAREPAPGRSEIATDECYVLAYDDRDRADTTFFPAALALAAGADDGVVRDPAGARGEARFWWLFGTGARWRRVPGDSLALTFSNGVSATDLVVAHDGERLGGRAEFRFQPESEPYPVLAVRGRRTECAPPP